MVTADDIPLTDAVALHWLIRELVDGWHSRPDFAVFRVSDQPTSIAILTFATHVHRVAPVVVDLLEAGLVLESTPLLRLAYECALTAQWLKQVPDGVAGFVNEGVRQRRAVAATLREASFTFGHELAQQVSQNLPADPMDSTSNASARQFAQLCEDLAGVGRDGYALYRLLTQYSHPSMYLSDLYLSLAPERPDGPPDYDPGAQLEAKAAWAHLMCSSLVWAGRAVDMADRNHPRRSELRDAARRLGINSELRISDRAWLRMTGSKGRP